MPVGQPPLNQKVHNDKGDMVPEWLLWFDSIWRGDAGNKDTWTPTLTALTEVGGSATITGRYFQLSRYLIYFKATITPVTNTSATAGTTYINNFPLNIVGDSASVHAATANTGGNNGFADSVNNRIYVPGWTTITTPITITGTFEAT